MTEELIKLAERVEAGTGLDNKLDVECEVALFEPDDFFKAARANDAGTKVIYTRYDGKDRTHWADDWTNRRRVTASALRARASTSSKGES